MEWGDKSQILIKMNTKLLNLEQYRFMRVRGIALGIAISPFDGRYPT